MLFSCTNRKKFNKNFHCLWKIKIPPTFVHIATLFMEWVFHQIFQHVGEWEWRENGNMWKILITHLCNYKQLTCVV
jgi:hypothetical protein